MEYIDDQIKDKIKSFFVSFRAELCLLALSGGIIVISLIVFMVEAKNAKAQMVQYKQPVHQVEKPIENSIYVDIAGAVSFPDVYKITQGSRLKDAIDKAGGFTSNADLSQIDKTINLSRILSDQEKIYIPKKGDDAGISEQVVGTTQSQKVNLNTASISELDGLSGIGEATAKKIIAGRPYTSVSELLSNKIVGKNLYDKIQNLISI